MQSRHGGHITTKPQNEHKKKWRRSATSVCHETTRRSTDLPIEPYRFHVMLLFFFSLLLFISCIAVRRLAWHDPCTHSTQCTRFQLLLPLINFRLYFIVLTFRRLFNHFFVFLCVFPFWKIRMCIEIQFPVQNALEPISQEEKHTIFGINVRCIAFPVPLKPNQLYVHLCHFGVDSKERHVFAWAEMMEKSAIEHETALHAVAISEREPVSQSNQKVIFLLCNMNRWRTI